MNCYSKQKKLMGKGSEVENGSSDEMRETESGWGYKGDVRRERSGTRAVGRSEAVSNRHNFLKALLKVWCIILKTMSSHPKFFSQKGLTFSHVTCSPRPVQGLV